ncbi:putative sensor domain DACNV-containing protein [Arcticibacter sp. MXS-1]|uniref:putative sensor domain DACNV-containing protein n=1 Tax=Arcticibacter sp. MXS-1 TaxID=3341726 RepID=UPI0035A8830C
MSYQSTYKPAGSVAAAIESHFLGQNMKACQEAGASTATPPPLWVIEALVDAAFWASLRKEEGNPPKISLAYLTPAQAGGPLLFEQRLPLNADVLTKLAPGVERAGIHLGVWDEDGELYIWGTTLTIPNLCFVLDVSEPGLLVIKHRRMCGFGKFTNVAVLKGDQVKIIDNHGALLPDCPPMLKVLLDLNSAGDWNDPVNVLIQLAVSMRSHGRGGALLVVPTGSHEWRHSIIHPVQYAIAPAFGGITSLTAHDGSEGASRWQGSLGREVAHIAGLTAVDGATVVNEQHELLAFGAKIGRKKGSDPVDRISFVEPIQGSSTVVVHPGHIGGTRHLSAAQFVYDQRNAVALVASQDGHFTVFSWSSSSNMVAAYRIDTLLL